MVIFHDYIKMCTTSVCKLFGRKKNGCIRIKIGEIANMDKISTADGDT